MKTKLCLVILKMTQETYNYSVDRVNFYKKNVYIVDDKLQKDFTKYIVGLEKLLDDEYKYGSSWYDIKMIEKYMDKCEQLVCKF